MKKLWLLCTLFLVVNVAQVSAAKNNEINENGQAKVLTDKEKAKQKKIKERKRKAKCKSNSRSTGSRIRTRC